MILNIILTIEIFTILEDFSFEAWVGFVKIFKDDRKLLVEAVKNQIKQITLKSGLKLFEKLCSLDFHGLVFVLTDVKVFDPNINRRRQNPVFDSLIQSHKVLVEGFLYFCEMVY